MATEEITDLIIGAGPAGLNAAITLAKHGIPCTLIDENPQIGGLIFRHSSRECASALPKDKIKARWDKLAANYQEQIKNINHIPNSEVVDVHSKEKYVVIHNRVTRKITQRYYRNLMICTGCHERGQPFPGWTLPGVMTVGGMQMQIKHNHVKPGREVVLVGTGPLLLLTAVQLTHIGVKVLGVFEAGRRITLLSHSWSMLCNFPMLAQGMGYLYYLRKHKVPVYNGWGIVSAQGKDTVESVTVAPYSNQWRPIHKQARTLTIDGLGVSYGFVSRYRLSYMARCEQEYNKDNGGFRPSTDRFLRTSVEHVYAAGDCAGVRGSEMAELEGQLMAHTVLADENIISGAKSKQSSIPLHNKIKKIASFRKALDVYSALQPGLYELSKDDTLVCRCENVCFKTIKFAIEETGVPDFKTLKMETRAGMGDCQGKTCSSFVEEYLQYKTNYTPMQIGCLRPRFPLVPLMFQSLSNSEEINEKK